MPDATRAYPRTDLTRAYLRTGAPRAYPRTDPTRAYPRTGAPRVYRRTEGDRCTGTVRGRYAAQAPRSSQTPHSPVVPGSSPWAHHLARQVWFFQETVSPPL